MRQAGFQRATPFRIWAVSDGKPGHANQALGLAEAIARRTHACIEEKRIALRTPHRWLPPRLVAAPLSALTLGSDGIAPPWPDLWIGCGRQTVPLGMGLRGWSGAGSLVVQVQDPRVNPREFDLVLAPRHDGLEDHPHIAPIIGALSRMHPEGLTQALAAWPQPLDGLASPRIAVLLGGASKRHRLSSARAAAIADALSRLARTGASLMVTLSRRTPPAARSVLRAQLAPHAALWWDGEGPNPYHAMLAAAEHVVVTEDSVSMACEAAATGAPVHVLELDGRAGKLALFHQQLRAAGVARPFRLPLALWRYPPLRETERCAELVLAALQRKLGASSGSLAPLA
jgi:hypothetical protein